LADTWDGEIQQDGDDEHHDRELDEGKAVLAPVDVTGGWA
jgi:hypothetical protein